MSKYATYKDVLEKLELTPDTPETRTCKFCNEPMHIVRLNKHIAFWVHKDKSIEICGEKNPAVKGKPVVLNNIYSFQKKAVELMLQSKNGEKKSVSQSKPAN